MTTLLLSHPATLAHEMGPGHPERPDRIRAVLAALEGFEALQRGEAPMGSEAAILRAHPQAYFDTLRDAAPKSGMVRLDADTAMNAGTWEAALRAAGGATAAVDAVMGGAAANAFVATRPPGHHAEHDAAMGFCFFNNVAIAARHAQAMHGAARVAIVDFDVHHGNGTQEIFWSDPSVLFCSTHEMPLYPGSGARGETGAHGTIVNAPLRAGDGGPAFRAAIEGAVLPRVDAFAPDLLLISAGFDAHRRDPLGNLQLAEADFAWVTEKLMGLAARHCGGRIVSLLEGGYDLEALAGSASAHVKALMGA